MRRKNGKLYLGILVSVMVLGIGYASITAIPLIINGSATAKATATQEDFNVHFNDFVSGQNYITYTETAEADSLTQTIDNAKKVSAASSNTDKEASITIANDGLSATVSVLNMTNIDDTVTLTIPVINESDDIKADLSASVVNNNEEYFNVTAEPAVTTLNGSDATTTVTVTVKVIKVPKVDNVNGTFTVTLTADPAE